jgi:predicted RNA-binding Zn-ribbon protein involved in translation (DUF1610 family)
MSKEATEGKPCPNCKKSILRKYEDDSSEEKNITLTCNNCGHIFVQNTFKENLKTVGKMSANVLGAGGGLVAIMKFFDINDVGDIEEKLKHAGTVLGSVIETALDHIDHIS